MGFNGGSNQSVNLTVSNTVIAGPGGIGVLAGGCQLTASNIQWLGAQSQPSSGNPLIPIRLGGSNNYVLLDNISITNLPANIEVLTQTSSFYPAVPSPTNNVVKIRNSVFLPQSGYSVEGLTLSGVEVEYSGVKFPTSSTSGTTAGTVTIIPVQYGTNYSKYIIQFSGYENDTTTNQTINFPFPLNSYAVITANNTGLTITASTTGITITAPNSTTTYNGIVIVEGY